jgi:hypothetical protein
MDGSIGGPMNNTSAAVKAIKKAPAHAASGVLQPVLRQLSVLGGSGTPWRMQRLAARLKIRLNNDPG